MRVRLSTVLLLGVCLAGGRAVAAERWQAHRLDAAHLPPEIVTETRRRGNAGLRDGLEVRRDGSGDITAAWYASPTRRYAHAILGDGIEAAELRVRTVEGRQLSLTLPKSQVFEDRYPRLADLDGDGSVEVITIRSSLAEGGSVAVYGVVKGQLKLRAATPYIGRPNRWLNIAGIADFQGAGTKQIAYVRTPHIGGTLFVYAFSGGSLVRLASRDGFSNHVIGAREMRLSANADVDGDGRRELALPSANRRRLRIVKLTADGLVDLASVGLPGRIDKAIGVRGKGAAARFIVGLDNGGVYDVHR